MISPSGREVSKDPTLGPELGSRVVGRAATPAHLPTMSGAQSEPEIKNVVATNLTRSFVDNGSPQNVMRRPAWNALEGRLSVDFPKLLLFKSPVGSKRLMRFGRL